ncbi:laminin subunit alpha-5-like, partial [Notechis scutatus]|uniref:Laminin subunit alpha-5-like n=1 Tax=Notechis scutatus TaxID=8663 RepID=A0A6J1W615_9SAUR
CDSCVLLLLEDLQRIESDFPALEHQLTSLNTTSIAWARLHSINGSMQAMTNQVREYQRSLYRVRQHADELEEENTDFVQDLNALQHK